MAINITSRPNPVELGRNNVRFNVVTDNMYATHGVKASVNLNFTGSCPLQGENFTLSYTDLDGVNHSFNYIFMVNPGGINLGSFQIETISPGDFVDDYVQGIVIPKLQENFYFLRDFIISFYSGSATDATVLIQAKTAGGFPIVTAGVCTGLTFSPVVTGVYPIVRENFMLLCQVFVEQVHLSGYFEPVALLDGFCNSSGQSVFNLESVLKSYLGANLFALNANTIAYCANLLKRYHIWLTEWYGSPPVENRYVREPVDPSQYYSVMNAYLKGDVYPQNNFYANYINSSTQKFLTNVPNPCPLTINQPFYLYLYLKNDNSFHVKVTLYYTDSTFEAIPHIVFSGSSHPGQVVIIPAGYAALDIDSFKAVGKTVLKYSIQLAYDSGADVSEVRTFLLTENSLFNKFFAFRNRLGATDVIACTGIFKRSIKTTRSQLQKVNVSDTPILISGQVTDDVSESFNVFEVATGWKSRAYIEYLEEFIESSDIFEITATQFKKIVLPESEAATSFEDYSVQDSFGFSFKYRYAHD